MANAITVNPLGVWVVAQLPVPRLVCLSHTGVCRQAWNIADMDGDEVVCDFGGIASSVTKLAILFREGVLLSIDLSAGLPNEWIRPNTLGRWASEDVQLVTYSSCSRQFILLSESGQSLMAIMESGVDAVLTPAEKDDECGNLSSVACSGNHIVGISHVFQEVYGRDLNDALSKWEQISFVDLVEPVFAAIDDDGPIVLGKDTRGRWVAARASVSTPIEGLPASVTPEGFAVLEDKCFVLYDNGTFDYIVACCRKEDGKYGIIDVVHISQ